MIELIQFPWSPFCLVQRKILEFSGAPFKITNTSVWDRSLVWRLTRGRYYGVPIIRDGRNVIFETSEESQVIAKYLDFKFRLGLFPREWEGLQAIVSGAIEDQIEGVGFKLNDSYFEEMVKPKDRLHFLRHKERKFGRGCIEQWRGQRKQLLSELAKRLIPFEQMLAAQAFLLDDRPRFVDFDLYGILANFLFSGHYELPAGQFSLRAWFVRMSSVKSNSFARS